MTYPARRVAGPWASSLLLVLAGTWAVPAAAVEPLDTFSVRLGGYVSRFDTRVRVDGERLPGTDINLRHDLGLDPDDTLGFAGVTWRPFERHEFALSYFSNDAASDHRLERDIVFDDNVYEARATVHTDYDFDAYELSYTWWGVSREDWALGPRLGLIWYQVELALHVDLDVNGEPVGENDLERRASADLPAPSIGVGTRWTPGEDWRLLAELGYFSTTISDVDGDVLYGRAGVEWHPWTRVGLMLDYVVSRVDLDLEKADFQGNLHFRNSGLRVGVIYRF